MVRFSATDDIERQRRQRAQYLSLNAHLVPPRTFADPAPVEEDEELNASDVASEATLDYLAAREAETRGPRYRMPEPSAEQMAQYERDHIVAQLNGTVPPSWCSGVGSEGHNSDLHDAIDLHLFKVQRPVADVSVFVADVLTTLLGSGWTKSELNEVADNVRSIGSEQARFHAGAKGGAS